MSALVLDQVTKVHPGSPAVTALRGVSLVVEEGELLGVVGPSGSGKSTLLAIAGSLERVTSGTVTIGGRRIDHLSASELASVRAFEIGFVFQQFFLVPTLSALDNVATGLLYRGLPRRARQDAARTALERVGLAARLSHRPSQLSGGECQRVAIARAIVGQPTVILADEPTGNIDSHQGEEIMAILRALNRDGATILVVTHNAEIAERLPRRIRVRDGVIDEAAA
jgi:putative ABC transport system ATP-binding protein